MLYVPQYARNPVSSVLATISIAAGGGFFSVHIVAFPSLPFPHPSFFTQGFRESNAALCLHYRFCSLVGCCCFCWKTTLLQAESRVYQCPTFALLFISVLAASLRLPSFLLESFITLVVLLIRILHTTHIPYCLFLSDTRRQSISSFVFPQDRQAIKKKRCICSGLKNPPPEGKKNYLCRLLQLGLLRLLPSPRVELQETRYSTSSPRVVSTFNERSFLQTKKKKKKEGNITPSSAPC